MEKAVEIEGVRVTHPSRILFPAQNATKRDLVAYYLDVADHILEHVADRPLSLVRCPKGRDSHCFYQKHASEGFPQDLRRTTIAERDGAAEYMYIHDKAGLVAAVQMGTLELHIWGARKDRIERPDRLVFDLDPDEGLDFSAVKKAAGELRDRLKAYDLQCFPMTTGGKGLHVVLPFERRHGWKEHRNFARAIATQMTIDSPERYVATSSREKRKEKIFIDFLRNDRGSTAIAPFSTRARRGAPVAFPVTWRALHSLQNADSVTIANAAKRLGRYSKIPWHDYSQIRQRLPQLADSID